MIYHIIDKFNEINNSIKQLNKTLLNQEKFLNKSLTAKEELFCFVDETTSINDMNLTEINYLFTNSKVINKDNICSKCLDKKEKLRKLEKDVKFLMEKNLSDITQSNNITKISNKIEKINSIQGKLTRYNHSNELYNYLNCTSEENKKLNLNYITSISNQLSEIVEKIQLYMRKVNIGSNFIIIKQKTQGN